VTDEVEDSIINFIPSYIDILNRSLLPIFVGGDLINKFVDKMETEEEFRNMTAPIEVGEASLLKGIVRGGLEKYLSPLKTKSARKLGNEKGA
jgi:hypothetical protein